VGVGVAVVLGSGVGKDVHEGSWWVGGLVGFVGWWGWWAHVCL
jgi:hypothetical protein